MRQTQEKEFYHLRNIEKTLDKLNAQKKEHLIFLNINNDSHFKELWGEILLKN